MISFKRVPQTYTPANNPIIFQIESDNTNIQFFIVQVLDDLNNKLANLKLYTTPNYRTGSYTDLSSILANTVNYELLRSLNLLEPTPNVSQDYKLVVTEKLYSANGIIDGITKASPLFYVWNGQIDKISFNKFSYYDYLYNTATNTSKFLTNKPKVSAIYRDSTEYLYFLNDSIAGNIDLNFYSANHNLITNKSVAFSGVTGCNRIDVSPQSLDDSINLFDPYFMVQFGTNFNISTTNYYTIGIKDISGNTKSEVRTYALKDSGCKNKTVNIVFANALGGFDGITFFNPREAIDVTKTTIQKNPFIINDAGIYSDSNNSVYNLETKTINVNSVSTYKVMSDVLSNEESVWLKELIKSEEVYIKLTDGTFYPITISNLNYPVQQKRFSTTNIRLELTFTITDTGISF